MSPSDLGAEASHDARLGAWFFLSPESVPPRWRARAVPVLMVPLLPEEASSVLDGAPARPQIGTDDEALLQLVAEGTKNASIARRLGITPRSVERRLARLRARFDVRSTSELVALLSRKGF